MIPTPILFFIILSVVVLIHELGHFLVAKLIGVKVEEFGFGYPPRVIAKKIGETLYSINLLPFGGFVRLFGEQEGDLSGKDKVHQADRAFKYKGKKKRAFVIVAGVVMNFLLGVVAFSLVYSIVGIPERVNYVVVQGVVPNGPAEKAGLKPEMRIVRAADLTLNQSEQFVSILEINKGKIILIEAASKVNKEWDLENLRRFEVTPRENPPEGEGALGILVANYDNIYYPAWQMPFRGAWVGIQEAIAWGIAMVVGLATMIWQWLTVGMAPQVAGPFGIYRLTGTVAEQGYLALIKFTGILSINLAVINLLPIPALDGGHLLFIFLEKIFKQRIKPVVEQWINFAGMALLLTLMLVITLREAMEWANTQPWWPW